MKKKRRIIKTKGNFLFPVIALFSICLCAVAAMLLVGGEDTIYYLTQRNFVPDEKTVCIDPGHGGSSSGATGEGGKRLEKDDNLRLSLAVRDILTERGYTVVMTRDSDTDISLEERCRVANKARASLFVSIHRNSAPNGKGMEMWIHSTDPSDDRLLAENILSELKNVGISADRGIHTGYRDGANLNYYINRNTKMPSCLAEIGFITSEGDNKDFDEKLTSYATAIADGIQATLREMNGS